MREALGGRVRIERLERGGPDTPFMAGDGRGMMAWPVVGESFEYLHVVEFAAPGVRRGLHLHAAHEESFLLFRGSLRVAFSLAESEGAEVVELEAGDLVRMAPGVAHALESLSPALTVHVGRGSHPIHDTLPVPGLAAFLRPAAD